MSSSPAETGLPYHEIQLAGRAGRWRQVVGSLAMIAWLALFAALVVLIPFAIWYAVKGYDINTLIDPQHVTPWNLAFTDIVLATLIPAAMLLTLLNRSSVAVARFGAPSGPSSTSPKTSWFPSMAAVKPLIGP